MPENTYIGSCRSDEVCFDHTPPPLGWEDVAYRHAWCVSGISPIVLSQMLSDRAEWRRLRRAYLAPVQADDNEVEIVLTDEHQDEGILFQASDITMVPRDQSNNTLPGMSSCSDCSSLSILRPPKGKRNPICTSYQTEPFCQFASRYSEYRPKYNNAEGFRYSKLAGARLVWIDGNFWQDRKSRMISKFVVAPTLSKISDNNFDKPDPGYSCFGRKGVLYLQQNLAQDIPFIFSEAEKNVVAYCGI